MKKEYSLLEKARKLFESYESKFNPYGGGPNLHYENMFRYGEERKQAGTSFNIDAFKIAVWLHDIGHYVQNLDEDLGNTDYSKRDIHKKKGIDIFDKEFRGHIGDSNLEEKIYACIRYHSGPLDKVGKEYLRRHPELQIIREADRISFLHPSFAEHTLKYTPDEKLGGFEKLIQHNYDELVRVVKPSDEGLRIAEKWAGETYGLIKEYKEKGK
jgi:predicted HD phosphohydrolase